jgi:hypothetical protein
MPYFQLAGDAVKYVREASKKRLYGPAFDRTPGDREIFLTFGVETLGAICPDAMEFVNAFVVRRYVVDHIGPDRDPDGYYGQRLAARFRRQVLTRISVALQHANAEVVRAAVSRRQKHNNAARHLSLVAPLAAPSQGAPKRRKRADRKARKRAHDNTHAAAAAPADPARARPAPAMRARPQSDDAAGPAPPPRAAAAMLDDIAYE